MDYPLEFQYIQTNGIQLHVVQCGPKEGPVVLLLHGFPEFWYGWRKQIPYLASQGFRVWAPDLRGYNQSDKPKGISAYHIDHLTADVVGLIEASGQEKVILCGHDWGAFLAWSIAGSHPERLEKVIILNVPHGSVMQRNLLTNPLQMLKSWYILFFQIPWLPEAAAKLKHWQMLVTAMTTSSKKGTFTEKDFYIYREAWSQPDAYHSMLNWYRALVQRKKPIPSHRIKPPLLLIWGMRDAFLSAKMAKESVGLCEKGSLVYLEEATHWVQHEEADHVNELIHEFLLEMDRV